MSGIICILIIILLIVFWCVSTVNGFRKKEIRVQEGLSGVEVALTKRYDMLTKMLDTAKGYMKHENELFTKVATLRRGMSVGELNAAKQQMDTLSDRLFAVAEDTPNFNPARHLLNYNGVSETQKNIYRRHGGSTTRMLPPTTRPLPCSRPSCWRAVVNPKSFSLPMKQSGKM